MTGGYLASGDVSYSSFGIDYQLDLAKHKPYRVLIGPGIGIRGQSNGDGHAAAGLGFGFESSLTGNTIFENVTGGIIVYYPTYYFSDNTIGVGGGIFISYNF